MHRLELSCLLMLVSGLVAQARFADPGYLVPRKQAQGAADPNNGDLYLIGGRPDDVLDLWRLRNGAWQRLAESPFQGTAMSLGYDAARQRLVAVLRPLAGPYALYEFDGTNWQTGPSLPPGGQLVYDTVRQQMLLWSTSTGGYYNYGILSVWNGSSVVPVPMTGAPWPGIQPYRMGYDTARGRAVVKSGNSVHEWDGATWSTVTLTAPYFSQNQVATDPQTGRVVYAFDNAFTVQNAYAWTGQAFVPWANPGAPYRGQPVFVGNSQRNRMQLVGGGDPHAHGDTWEFDGASWQQVTPDTAHPVFVHPRMVATGPGTALLFDGGENYGVPVAQTAQFANGSWTLLQPAHSPQPRTDFALASDVATGRVFLFGGQSSSGLLGDFWMWDGTDWQQLPGGPSPRADHGLCYRADAQRVVLYGSASSHDTWEWDGTAWLLRGTNWPPHLGSAHLAYHALRQRSVLMTTGLNGIEVWEWDGINWFSTNPPQRPTLSGAPYHTTYDPVRESIVLVDAVNAWPTQPGRAHEWDGGAWRSFASDPRLTSTVVAVAGLPGTGVVVQHGMGRFPVTLTHDFPASAVSFGTSCYDPLVQLTANQPWLGNTYTLRYPTAATSVCLFVSGFSNTQAGSVPLPLDLGFLALPGCQLRVAPDFVSVQAVANGTASLPIAVPSNPALAGLGLFHQAIVLESGAASASQGLAIVIGSLW